MPCLSIPYNPSVGPQLQLAVFPPGYNPPQAPAGPNPTNVSLYTALVDTGASCTCVSAKVISDIGLMPSGKIPVGGVHGSQAANQYQFIAALIFGQMQAPNGAVLANMHAYTVLGVEFVPNGNFDVLLGRDILCRGVFTMSWDGHATFCV